MGNGGQNNLNRLEKLNSQPNHNQPKHGQTYSSHNHTFSLKPYKGYFQLYGQQGHMTKCCPSIRYMPWNTQSLFQPQSGQHSRPMSNAPRVHFAAQPDHASSS